jgi:hypothetical protein
MHGLTVRILAQGVVAAQIKFEELALDLLTSSGLAYMRLVTLSYVGRLIAGAISSSSPQITFKEHLP